MDSLNPRQQEAVQHTDSPLLVLAGAGSGKTRVITYKIAHLIRHCALQASHIAAVTFTNKAAKEMKQRATALLGGDEQKGLRVSTFHTLGLNILRQGYGALGYRSGFSIFDATDSLALLKEQLKRDGDDAVAEAAQWKISAWKSALICPEDALRNAADSLEANTARLYAQYQRSLKAFNGFDFDDLIGAPVRLFREHPTELATWRERIRYLLADEYQDTNQAQYELLRLLAGAKGRFTVVGDDDQSIYTWRGANPENLNQLKDDYQSLRVIKLEQNYRSSGNILNAANGLIAHNPHLFEKSLWSAHGPGDTLRVIRARDEHDEVTRVVSDIMLKRMQGKGDYGEFAVLYRGNHQARLFEQGLRGQNVPYHLSGGRSFFDRTEVRDVMAYLRLLANADDDTAFLRIVNVPRREIGTSTLEGLGTLAQQRESSLFDAIFDSSLGDHVSARGAAALSRFANMIVKFADQAQRSDPIDAARDLVDAVGYRGWIDDTSKDERMAEKRVENLTALIDWLARIAGNNPKFDLADVLAHISLLDRLDDSDEPATGQVRLMTLHAAKGLEFNNVYLVGVEEGLLPHHQNTEGPGLEEERRLAYVGITRAMRRLTMTFASGRRRYGEQQSCEPSRFLSELPDELLTWDGDQPVTDAASREATGATALAQLRAMLSG